MRRRDILLHSAVLPVVAVFGSTARAEDPMPFDSTTVRNLAKELAQRGWQAPNETLPDPLGSFQIWYARWGLAVILIKGLTPIPYKIVTIASGAAEFSFPVFMAASLVTRGARFFLVAALLRAFGSPVRDFIERRLTLVTSMLAAGIVGGFLVLRLM